MRDAAAGRPAESIGMIPDAVRPYANPRHRVAHPDPDVPAPVRRKNTIAFEMSVRIT